MTRLAILGDIHGNLPALEAVWADLEQHDVDHVIIAGDVINWGPFSREVLEFLDERREYCSIIRGNHEFYVLDYDSDRVPASRKGYTMPPWTHSQIGDSWRRRIAGWPDSLQLRFPDGPLVRVIHGSPRDHWEGFYPQISDETVAEMLASVAEPVVITAHTHLPMDRASGRWHILNPGTVGVPLDANPDAGYLLLTTIDGTWQPEFRRVPYDRSLLFERMAQPDFLDTHGLIGRLIIEEFRTATVQVAPFLRWMHACHPGEAITAEHLANFTIDIRRQFAPPAHREFI
jgi:predicted phosphodiesterase